jgi:prepilin-type N-terminal cleavage/methylation domain-containing protein
MIRKQSGFTLLELIITLILSGLVIAAASSAFIGLLGQSRTQARIAESHEGLIGLEILRRDIESAGYGLAWDGLAAYSESAGNPFGLNDAPTGAPRAVISQDNVATYAGADAIFNGSDYLVIKSVIVARNAASERGTTLKQGPVVRVWTPASENLANSDRVIVLSPHDVTTRPVVVNGAAFWTTYNNLASFAPTDANDTYMAYGINTAADPNPVRPFNRADYYISRSIPGDVPARCAPNTGIFYKAAMNHDAGGTSTPQVLMDCVADMQVIYGLDNDGDGSFQPLLGVDGYSDSLAALPTAQLIRTRVKEVRVYILTHEGRMDPNYIHPQAVVHVGEPGLGRDVVLGANVNYRWKVYRLTVKPLNLY